MSHWHYQIMRHVDDNGDAFLKVHEFFIGHDKKESWTAFSVPVEADSVPEMRMTLLDILRDLERHGVRDVNTGEVVQAGTFVQM
jgi:hypothetical protein